MQSMPVLLQMEKTSHNVDTNLLFWKKGWFFFFFLEKRLLLSFHVVKVSLPAFPAKILKEGNVPCNKDFSRAFSEENEPLVHSVLSGHKRGV